MNRTGRRDFVFWQNFPSIHQAPLQRALVESGRRVVVLTDSGLTVERSESGWPGAATSGVNVLVAPTKDQFDDWASKSALDVVHVVSGLGVYPLATRALQRLDHIRRSRKEAPLLGLYAEPLQGGGIKGMLRRLRMTWRVTRWRRSIDFVLATGDDARAEWVSLGFPLQKVFTFPYVVEPVTEVRALPARQSEMASTAHKFMFVGQLVPRKGVDLLIEALTTLPPGTWSLQVIGTGPSHQGLQRLARDLDVADSIAWLGVQPNQKVRELMQVADTLVVPSRFDGWGAVINESLGVGTPVVASSTVGASCLIRSLRGSVVFSPHSTMDLRSALLSRISEGTSDGLRRRTATWAGDNLSPAVSASYLLAIVQHVSAGGPKPLPPWERQES